MIYFTALLLSAFITVSLIPLMTRLAETFQLVDFPGPRKVHTRPVPRVGGLAAALGAFVPVILWAASGSFMKAYLVGAGLIVAFGLIDDIKGLGHEIKFAGQFFAAVIVVLAGGIKVSSLGTLLPGSAQLPGWVAVPLTIISIIGVTNAINLSDGLDGLAGGISFLVFCSIGYFGYLEGNRDVILLSLALAGAIFGFLRYNTHPASLFMGDTGSQLLGFSAAVLAIKITQGVTPFSPVLPLVTLGFPVLDTLTVMVERIRGGRSPFSADKNHFHHRLIRLGLSHAEAVFAIYVIQAVMIIVAILFKYSDWILMIYYMSFSVLIVSAFSVADRMGFQFKRFPKIGNFVEDRLRKIRDNWISTISFSMMRAFIPLMLIFSCLLPSRFPGYMTDIAICFGLSILTAWIFAKKYLGFCLRSVLYVTVPSVLYLIQQGRVGWIEARVFTLYHLSFGVVAVLVLLMLRFARKAKGFKATTMDFLIIFIAILVPNLPDQSIQSYHLGLMAVEIIVFLFSYEVLISELKGRLNALAISTLMAMAMIAIRSAAGF
ncbi:MAG: MraY family glycosyltransferase [Nitrospiraceae bacterium]|nr:MraY family glycosyltransferase [Nitrospiraceae bacterium]